MFLRQKYLSLLVVPTLFWFSLGRAEEDFSFFETKIRPVLVEHCYKCHSAEAEKLKGKLRLDSKAGMLKGGESGAVIVPGKPEESLLIKAVRYTDKDLQMPPKDQKLSEAQIADLITWVKMGAPDPRTESATVAATPQKPAYDFEAAQKLWAFSPPQDPPRPKVKRRGWVKSPIDQFVLAKLEEKGLSPAKPAEKRTLLRRVTFDLIGLPPTPEEIDAFLNDKSLGAFAKVVDRLLASPHYGERWARHWLDVVRYTDSLDSRIVGTEQDIIDAWRYRDWVVNAFNRDLPYDRFITEQVAGDLLPSPQPDGIDTNAIIATGMYAVGNWGNGDADKEKILTDIADDAVDVTGRAFLGLTLACARCHDHKFDPIPTADYYSLAGIFFSSHIIPKLTAKGAGEALLRIPLASKTEMEQRKQREARIAELEKQIEKTQDEQIAAVATRAKTETERYLMAAWEYQTDSSKSLSALAESQNLAEPVLRRWISFLGSENLGLLSQPLRNLLNIQGLNVWRMASGAENPSVVANSTDQEIVYATIKLPAHHISMHPSPKDGVAAAWKSPVTGAVHIKGRVVDIDPNCGDGIEWSLVKLSGPKETPLAKGSIPSGGMEQLAGKESAISCQVQAGDYVQLNIFPKGAYECDTTMIELEVVEAEGQKRVWDINQDVASDLHSGNPHSDRFGNADIWRFRDLAVKSLTASAESGVGRWLEMAKGSNRVDLAEVKRVAAQMQKEVLDTTVTNGVYMAFAVPRGSFWAPLRNEEKLFTAEAKNTLQKDKAELSDLRSHPPAALLMAHGLQEGGVPESPHAGVHDVKIHVRGRYDRLGELVPRGFPRIIAGDHQTPFTEGSGRLQLAKWLGSPANPLTARVMMNRIWQHHFGEGIVRTPNNYGKLGTPPTHPELLDYLARRFVESGWSIKAMHRSILLSAVYQQSSVPERATLNTDPENKLLGRMPRQRLDAESLRDSLLAAAGRLDRSLGGAAIRDLNNDRRTLYLMTIRSDRSNYRAMFDGADSTAIVESRVVSTVAPQALFLLNHPFVIAQAKALAGRVTKFGKLNDGKKIEWLYQMLYGRLPVGEEVKIGRAVLEMAHKEKQPVETAWLEYCQTLLCANEFVYAD
ncbi:MAG: Protein of unknown function (DUF1553)/Protein of unknown function (DUF1549)/Planctomycete [Verrucomicrobiales bacterium]|nr:Protein of unknown function (DUF1553)/Protein of unknown function (DUF1549)/Planctomycete [Verrucomicrobiales bacterium]